MLNFLIKKKNMFDKSNSRNLKTECPICLEILRKKDDNIVKCPICLNAIHKSCMQSWLFYKKKCVFCESEIWSKFK